MVPKNNLPTQKQVCLRTVVLADYGHAFRVTPWRRCECTQRQLGVTSQAA